MEGQDRKRSIPTLSTPSYQAVLDAWTTTRYYHSIAFSYLKRWIGAYVDFRKSEITKRTDDTTRDARIEPLPTRRKRALSIDTIPATSSWKRLLLVPARSVQNTDGQHTCLFLSRVPPEIRNLIYADVLGNRVLHIIPSLVPSQTKTKNGGKVHLPRLDHEPCKWPRHPDVEVEFVGQRLHSACANWIGRDGELYFKVPQSIIQGGDLMETGFLRWWSGKNRTLALLKTCRQIYSEAIHVLYTSNAFDFRSLRVFKALATTTIPRRWYSIRIVHIRLALSANSEKEEMVWEETCQIIQEMKGLQQLALMIEDKTMTDADVEKLVGDLSNVVYGRNVILKVRWVERGEWKGVTTNMSRVSDESPRIETLDM